MRGAAVAATWTPSAGTSQRDGNGDALSPAHKINDESDDEYRPETDIHIHLRWYFRLLIAAQARQPVGTLPHLTQLSLESLLHPNVSERTYAQENLT